jgi:pimeloyl-ACP methyl ester carboxylesterase
LEDFMKQTHFFEHQGGRIAYDDRGSGPLVVCSPSLGDLRGEYRYLIPYLAGNGFRAVSMDVRGHGETSVEWPDYSVAAVGSDLLALIRHLDAGPAVIAGTSMSAGAAVWAAAEAPELVSGLVLIGPVVGGETSPGTRLMISALFARPWGPGAWLSYYSRLFTDRKPHDHLEYTARLKANLAEPGRLEAMRRMIFASKAASEARLDQVSVPALVVMGSKDPDFKDPAWEAHRLGGRLNAQVRLIENVGHYPQVESPEEVGPLVLSFLQRLRQEQERVYA